MSIYSFMRPFNLCLLCFHNSSNPSSLPCLCFYLLWILLWRSTGYSEVIVVVGGCERVGGFNLPYTECYDPVTGEWKSLAKLPEFTKSEYAVCALRNDILVSGKTLFTLLQFNSSALPKVEINIILLLLSLFFFSFSRKNIPFKSL